jgi:hypothetical protein
MRMIGIDVLTEDAARLVEELEALAHVNFADNAGQYLQDRGTSQVLVSTDLTEEQLEDWLYEHSEAEYVGIFFVWED